MSRHRVDAELARAASALPRIDRTDVAEARRIFESRVVASGRYDSTDEGVTVENHTCTAADGHRIGLRLYRPEAPTSAGAVYHVHGGGFMVGDLEMSHLRNVEIAREVGATVVSVDYRLAPEWPFPAPVEDVYSGLVWLHEQADGSGIDPSLIALHGVSAGGGLVASTTLLARDRGGPPICFQFLASPALDDRLVSDSSRRFTDSPALDRRDAEICWSTYLGSVERGGDAVPGHAAPARTADLTRLPRAYVSVAELDPLRDDGIDYARSLLVAGVPVELHLFPGTFHGSSAVPEAEVSRRERAEEIAVLSRVMSGSYAQTHVPSHDLEGDPSHA